ncbi:response regulator [Shivajiella indica]|uniref:Response regulator n=1 Tax=Shivajiella indica TaxID=872115 RepID=A0ABW5BCF4_9BACT
MMSEMNQRKIKILYVDDEEINLQAFRSTFKKIFDLFLAGSANEARKILTDHEVDIIIADQRMPSETGLNFFTSISSKYPEPIRILLTAYTDMHLVTEAVEKKLIYHYLTKPWDEAYFKNIIENAYESYFLRRQNKFLEKQLKEAREQLETLSKQIELS